MNKKIELAIRDVKRLKWRDLQPFQPDNLKIMTADEFQKLQNNIEYNDFDSVPYVWEGEKQYWLLDGHHRKYALEAMEKKGYQIPEELFCAIVDVNTREEANAKLLDYSSNHAQIDRQGLIEFCYVNGLDLSEMNNRLSIHGVSLLELAKDNQDIDLSYNENTPRDQTEFTVLINCNNENEQQKIYEEMQERGFECKLIM